MSSLAPAAAGRPPVEAGRDAAASLYGLHRQRIHAYCLGQLRDRQEADDAVQSTFLYAFALLQRGAQPTRALPWLYTIAHNVCRTRRRALRRRSRLESCVDLETLHESLGRSDPPREDLDGLADSLAQLPEPQRVALLLREWQGLSYREIALRLDLTDSAVEALLFRARRNLAQRLRLATGRLASLAGTLPAARRLASLGGTTKATAAAAVAVGLAAASTAVPSHHAPRPADRPRPAAPAHVAADVSSGPHRPLRRARHHVRRAEPSRSGAAAVRAPASPEPAAAPVHEAAAPAHPIARPAAPAPLPAPAAAAPRSPQEEPASPEPTPVAPEPSPPQPLPAAGAADAAERLVGDAQAEVVRVRGALPPAPDAAAAAAAAAAVAGEAAAATVAAADDLPPAGSLLRGRP